jgi:hypothetical protein
MTCPICNLEADDHTHELTSRFIAYRAAEIDRLTEQRQDAAWEAMFDD